MPRTCTICKHSDRETIERALPNGEAYRNIASRFGTSTTSLHRHRLDHLGASIARAHEAETVARAELLEDVRTGGDRAERLYTAAEGILARALEVKDLKTALQAIKAAVDVMREGRSYLELKGEITGELGQPAGLEPAIPGPLRVFVIPKLPGVEQFPPNPPALNALLAGPPKDYGR